MFKHINYFRFPLVLIALGIIGLTSCSREADPLEDAKAAYAGLRVDSTMSTEEYLHTSDLVYHPATAPAGTTTPPSMLASTSNRVYDLTYANYATLTVGGAVYNHTNSQWLSGTAAGNAYFSASQYQALLATLSKVVRYDIGDNPIPWWPEFTLRPITFTQIDRGNVVLSGGLYRTDTRNYLYLGGGNAAGGQVGSTPCGAISFGAFHGYMAPDYGSTTGYLSFNLIVGCSPVIVTASLSIYFTGVARP